ncbi:MAG: FAD-dependent oxidoreductase [Burkholderiaceae bacterium]|nr:MAG: FAD-dependent oxidoreductase [Burkholderiaceae bacterium]
MTTAFAPYPFTAAQHPAALPPLHDGCDAQRRPVVVVGAGPVGFCSAIGLARHGVPVVLLEADDSVCFGSRAICISRRSLEIAERLGALVSQCAGQGCGVLNRSSTHRQRSRVHRSAVWLQGPPAHGRARV